MKTVGSRKTNHVRLFVSQSTRYKIRPIICPSNGRILENSILNFSLQSWLGLIKRNHTAIQAEKRMFVIVVLSLK